MPIIGCMVYSLFVDKSLIPHISRHGLLVVALRGGFMAVQNEPDFQPGTF